MKILLINPSLQQAEIGHYKKAVEKQRGTYPSLGLAYIAAALQEQGETVKIIDCDAEGGDFLANIKTACQEFQPEVIGFHVMTWTYRQVVAIIREIKIILPTAKIIVGGPHINSFPRETLAYCPPIDMAVKGEGEETVKEIINAFKNNQPLDNVLGIIYRQNGEIKENPNRPYCQNLDALPQPARELLPMEKYYDVFTKEDRFATLIATRGCPFNCTFCDRQNRMGRNWRKRSAQNIVQEIKAVQQKFGIKEFMFFDDNLIVDKNWILELCREIEKENLKIIWECRTRVDTVDEEILKAIKKAGCYRIRFGFEAGDNHILAVIKKGITVEQSLKCAELAKKTGVEMFGYFMLGVPEETEATMKKTIDLAIKIDPAFAIFSKIILIPGSEIFDWAVQKGYIENGYWQKFLRGEASNPAPSLTTKELPEETINSYVSLANKKFYIRPSFVIKKMLAIRSFKQLIKQAKMAKGLLLG